MLPNSNALQAMTEIALRAGASILELKDRGVTVKTKDNGSPVTEADLGANDLICKSLCRNISGLPSD